MPKAAASVVVAKEPEPELGTYSQNEEDIAANAPLLARGGGA